LSALLSKIDEGPNSPSQFKDLKDLEACIHYSLEKEEKEWRLKSRAIWLEVGENDTNNFHQFANFRRNINTIWEIKNEDGKMSSSFLEKVKARERFIEKLYVVVEGCPIQ
jgi:hypothetical protein